MIKFFMKQFLYGRFYLWLKTKLFSILFIILSICSICYLHNEYLKYHELYSGNYLIGLSFIVKNISIIVIIFGYLIFEIFFNRSKKDKEKLKIETKDLNNSASSLDKFLDYEEINR